MAKKAKRTGPAKAAETAKDQSCQDESLADFWWRLKNEGVDMGHIHQMLDFVARERAKEIAKAANLFHDGEWSRIGHADKLIEMKSRCWALVVAIMGADSFSRCSERDGVIQLANDVAYEMERISKTFSAERRLRRAEAGHDA